MKARGLLLGALGAALAVALLSVGAAQAQSIRANGGGGGVASALVCLLTGGAGCTMTGGIELDETNTLCSSPLAISWDTDENTGWQRSAADTIEQCIGGQRSNTESANTTEFRDSAGGLDLTILRVVGSEIVRLHTSLASIFMSSTVTAVGMSGNRTSFQAVLNVSDTQTNVSSGVVQQQFYGEGGRAVVLQQAITIADDGAGTSPTSTTVPTSEQVEVTCNDVNGCNYNPADTSVPDGFRVTICNLSAANTVTIADTAGSVIVRGIISLVLAADECSECTHTGTVFSCL